MTRTRAILGLTALMIVVAPLTMAAFKTTVTKSEDFEQAELSRVAVVTVECDRTVDCSAVERKIYTEVQRLKVRFQLVPESTVRGTLFSHGHTEYSSDLRSTVASELDLDGLIELKIPFAERGDGYGGRRGSQVKAELLLIRPSGKILMHAVGTGRPKNVVTSPERVAGNLVEKILREAFK